MNYEPVDVLTELDPRLQRLVDLSAREPGGVEAVEEGGEVPVIARVTNSSAWAAIDDVKTGAVVGETEEGMIVTGRIPVSRIESVRRNDAVRSLKAAQRLRPVLAASIAETHARADLLPPEAEGDQGTGVIVGLVDSGCDFAHRNFRNEDGTTRIVAIWDQSGDPAPDSPFGLGRLHRKDAIDQALQAPDPYGALAYGPAPDSGTRRGAHGTHVMDIAAGNGLGSGTPGFAPHASIVFAEPAASDIVPAGPGVVGSEFGDSAQLLEAVRFIFDEAGATP